MVADFQNVTTVNIHAPPGAERRRDRANVVPNELPYILRGIPPSFLVGGILNSVLTNLDATVHPNYSRALQEYLREFDIVGIWETSQERVMWWERVAKVHIKKLFIREGTVKRREETQMQNIYYAYLYDMQRPIQHA